MSEERDLLRLPGGVVELLRCAVRGARHSGEHGARPVGGRVDTRSWERRVVVRVRSVVVCRICSPSPPLCRSSSAAAMRSRSGGLLCCMTGRGDEPGPLLTASAGAREDARDEVYAQVPEGHRPTWIRRTT